MEEIINFERQLSNKSLQILSELRKSGQLCDAVLHTEDRGEFEVHRSIMSACSPYFRALLTNTISAKNSKHFSIPGVSSQMMNLIIDYAYTRDSSINWDNVQDLLPAADQFNVMGMVHLCCAFLSAEINPENCIGIRRFAHDYYCPELEKMAYKYGIPEIWYLMANFAEIAKLSEELLWLPLEEVVAMFSSEDLNVSNEEIVWEAICRWIDFAPEVRRKHMENLMHCVRLGLLESDYFMKQVKGHPYVADNEACRPLVIATLRFLSDLETISEREEEVPTPEMALPRIPYEILFAIGGWSGGSPTNYIESYDSRADRWIRVGDVDPAGPRAYHKCAVVGYDIYVIGGFDGVVYFSGCRCFNAVTKTWREVAPMNSRSSDWSTHPDHNTGQLRCRKNVIFWIDICHIEDCKDGRATVYVVRMFWARCYVSVAVLDGFIYAMGGFDGVHRQNTAERYNFLANQWTYVVPMNMQRSDASAATLEDCIYITGGFNGSECLSSAECYNPRVNQWTMIAPMISRRSGVSCISYHGSIFVLGGFNGMSRLCSGEKYNPRTNTWTSIPDMMSRRSNFAMEVVDDMVFAIGGYDGETIICQVECYDEKTDQWFEATDMNIFRSALAACVVPGLPNARDYIHKHRDRLLEEKRLRLLEVQQLQNNFQNMAAQVNT
ncbi:KLHL10 [Cordylochernes scorpioides]|uniref:Kelch-like protein diablo n=1 Tax=Cordylochernes scorpioides TaxID=51811 RepID=A0ABY6LCA3_9ARAC|nr:KLHL10 [Cordylochernes scorpioides]